MLNRIHADNVFVTRIKDNTIYESVEELELPQDDGQDIIKVEIIQLSGQKAKESGINHHQLRLIHVYKPDENKVIVIITDQIEWKARTIAEVGSSTKCEITIYKFIENILW